MKITICGSIAFIDEMDALRRKLELLGHEVKLPPLEVVDETGKTISVKEYYAIRKSASDNEEWVWKKKAEAMHWHFDKVAWADVVLILNKEKNGVAGYVGANTLLEMELAFYLGKNIYLMNPLPEVSYKEEILGMQPIVIGSDLSKISL